MLQPRFSEQHSRTPWTFLVALCSFVLIIHTGFAAQYSEDEPYVVEPTPALRLQDDDLTTVLLVNNDNRAGAHGRYLNVKPAVGLLTSTARTFIQEGVTTEYATQVLGTTLDNGRLYAQLLKKSSRVLYDKDTESKGTVSTVTGQTAQFNPQRSLLQSHNDLVADQDWQLIDDHLLGNPKSNLNTFVRNTDFIAPINNPNGALLVFPTRSYVHGETKQRSESNNREIVMESHVNVEHLEQHSNESFSISSSSSSSSSTSSNRNGLKGPNIAAEKVQPQGNLPTFTVKNVFAPSGFSWDSNGGAAKQPKTEQMMANMPEKFEYRSPKFLYNKIKDDERMLSTVTYYGFADFTTIVGDTVIVFSPSTSHHSINPEHITSIKGEATLGAKDAPYVTHVPITVTQDLIEPTFTLQTVATINPFETDELFSGDDEETNQESPLSENPHDQTEIEQDQVPETTTPLEEQEEDDDQEGGQEQEQTTALQDEQTTLSGLKEAEDTTEQEGVPRNELESSMTVIEDMMSSSEVTPGVAESSTEIKMLTTPSNEDILKIYASLASAEAAKKIAAEESQQMAEVVIAKNEENDEKINAEGEDEQQQVKPAVVEPEIKILGGATTIFFEDDPFQAFESTKVEGEDAVEATAKMETPQITPETQRTTTDEMIINRFGETEATTTGDQEPTSTTNPPTPEGDTDEEDERSEGSTERKTDETAATRKIEEHEHNDCSESSDVIYSQQPKTLTYLTTYFIPGDAEETSTSIESNVVTTFDIVSSTKYPNCPQDVEDIDPSRTARVETFSTESPPDAVIEKPAELGEEDGGDEKHPTTTIKAITDSIAEETTIGEKEVLTSTEKAATTVGSESENPDEDDAAEEEDDEEDEEQETEGDAQQSGEEIELIYKTLYTTYTYLTTFFHDSTTSISSRKEIVTNVVTSTVSPSMLRMDLDVTDILSSMTVQPSGMLLDDNEVAPKTSVGIGRPTTKFVVQQSDLVQIDDILREEASTEIPNIAPSAVKTLFTTYTYYTTIFVDGETEVMSRTEVHTNYISGGASEVNATAARSDVVVDTVISDDDNAVLDIKPTASYETIQRSAVVEISGSSLEHKIPDDESDIGKIHMSYSTLTRARDSVEEGNTQSPTEKSEVVTMVTDVRSSSSDGDRQIIENINKQWNGLFEDQISSESNTEDILPSPTLLLQTSYTTFTFYTTMYSGTATNVVSRLETVTNVVTETLQPTQTISSNDATLPITYFTTFTYWTTLAKDGEITTISREETVSNVVQPSTILPAEENVNIDSTSVSSLEEGKMSVGDGETVTEATTTKYEETIHLEGTTSSAAVDPTTFYTTYTYFTTSYAGEETIINSRFETVTNIVTPTVAIAARAIDVNAADLNRINNGGKKEGGKSEPVYIATTALPTVLSGVEQQSPPQSTESAQEENSTPKLEEVTSSILSLNKGKIVDADGISTIFYTTQTIATKIDGTFTELTQKASSINIDEVKKALVPTDPTATTKSYKTGLVRLIEGTMIANRTTTLYQSKVIGTVIEGRYAQIIESTSSFLIEKTLAPSTGVLGISPTNTLLPGDGGEPLQTTYSPTPTAEVIEGSIGDDKEQDSQTEISIDDEEDEGGVDENGRPRSRLTFSTRKRTFTPVIRPFASRNRPQFAPKRKNLTPSSATIITRSDFTPTITATPAIKPDSSRGRFSSIRKSSAAVLTSSGGGAGSSSRRFSRPRASTSAGFASSSAFPGGSRNRASSSRSQIQPTSSSYFGISSRRGGSAGSRGGGGSSSGRFSSVYLGNSRLRIKPTASSTFDPAGQNTNLYTTEETEIEEDSSTPNIEEVSEEEDPEAAENARRNQNPLLRFRRPPIVGKTPGVRVGQISTRRNPLTQRAKTTTTTTTTTTTSKPRPRAFQRPPIATFQQNRRPQSSLFPPRGLFRPQTINQDLDEENKKPEEENDFADDLDAEGGDYEDDEGEDEEEEEEDIEAQRRRRDSSSGGSGGRSKRQADYGNRNFRNRFRRPTIAKSIAEERIDNAPVEEDHPPPKARTTGRYTARNLQKTSPAHTTNSRIRPTKPSATSRAQFTLREKDTVTKPSRASNFRRPTTSGNLSTRRTATTIGRPKAPRLKSYTNSVTESTYTSRSTSGRTRQTTSRGRSTTRSRPRTTEFQPNDPVLPSFDGTITVTHHIPTEITIPVVNGGVTEYKNIVTAKISTEIVGPNQYNTLVNRNGNAVIVLSREDTIVNNNGATEVTQFILHETPTTSIVFTPTTIRGRRTSFSHIIPSTVYEVENVVSTIQPQIAANAPLANILLSQLLLGNIGLQQQNLNPLLGLGAAQPGVPGTPTTEFKTRTTTYVTTVTNEMSTVIPLTFRGKEILTTIVDSSVNVITATEFLTDTIVVTPTQAAVQQVNSLLLPLLLQQQVQAQQNPLALQNTALPQLGDLGGQQILFQDSFQEIDTNRIHKVNLDEFQNPKDGDDFPDQEAYRDKQEQQVQPATHHRKRHRKGPKHSAVTAQPSPPLETSVITLYVSGRRPGEFSTVLSTIVNSAESSLHKREVEAPVEKSAAVTYADMYTADESEIKEYLLPATNEINSSQQAVETESLESIVGDVSEWYHSSSSAAATKPIKSIGHSTGGTTIASIPSSEDSSVKRTKLVHPPPKPEILGEVASSVGGERGSRIVTRPLPIDPTHIRVKYASTDEANNDPDTAEQGRHFPGFSGFKLSTQQENNAALEEEEEDAYFQAATSTVVGDEARYNLATRIMSNGVEVIVASDKNHKSTQKQSIFRILPSNLYRPLTLAPSTLKDQMIMVMPTESKDNFTIPINPNQFVTKTCLTTYTYRTTYLQNGTTTVESQEQVISNIATEERNYMKISPTASFGVTLSRTPELAIGVFHTTYTYLNTILDGEQPIVVSSRHTVTNTITGPDDYISLLQPSEEATPAFETNTYFSKILITKTLKDSNIHKLISSSNLLTQVIVTESLSPKNMAAINSYAAFDVDETSTAKGPVSDLLKTQYVTYTYYNTVVDDEGSLSVETIVSASPDVVTEKFFLYKQTPSAEALVAPTEDNHQEDGIRPTIFTDHHVYSTAMATNSINIYNPGEGDMGAGQNTIHVYATKTYLTTFTYFTTLLKSSETEVSSTVVSSHTRVIENVITESIPNYLLDSRLLERFSQELNNPNGKHATITTATLLGGQSLEVTAINVLKPIAVIKTANSGIIGGTASNSITKPTLHIVQEGVSPSAANFISPVVQDVENSIVDVADDSEGAESELNYELYPDEYSDATKLQSNGTKIAADKGDYPPLNGLMGSLNLNGLTALGPVINAMADLLQNNFGGSPPNKRNVTDVVKQNHHIGAAQLPYSNVTFSNGGIISGADQSHRSPIYIPVRDEEGNVPHQTQSDFYSQPGPASFHIFPPEKWPVGDEKMNRNNKLEFPLSKPTHETPLLNGGIAISPGEVITANSDVIVGKPAGTRPRVPFNTKLKDVGSAGGGGANAGGGIRGGNGYLRGKGELTPNVIPLNRYQGHITAADKHFENFIRPPPPLAPPQQYMQKQTSPYQGMRQPPGHHRNTFPSHGQNPQRIPLLYPPPQTTGDALSPNKAFVANNEILEIKRIPEVYSTDLPPVEIGYQHHHVQKIISTEKPMLVNIQPSQVANVVIPHGNANSVLIIESTAELHKNGHYFDEPAPYPEGGSSSSSSISSSNKRIPAATYNKPVLTNQKINLDSHILSHNVDIHVPPITFKKENDFPLSKPIRGHIQQNGPIHMAHVNIPATDHEIEVKLTPHHVSLPNSYLQGQNSGHHAHLGGGHQGTPSEDIALSASSSLVLIPPHRRAEEKPFNATAQEENALFLPPLKPLPVPYGNKQYSSGLEFGSYRKPQSTYLHHHNNPLKRRPAGHQFNQMKESTVIKPRPIIPLHAGEFQDFHTTAKPTKTEGTSLLVEKNVFYLPNSPFPAASDNSRNPGEQEYSQPSMTDDISYDLAGNDDDDDAIDDYENEEGEVVQESNSLPVLPGQYLINRLEPSLVRKGSVFPLNGNVTSSSYHLSTSDITTPPIRTKEYPNFMYAAINGLGRNNFTALPHFPLSPLPGRPFTPVPGQIPPSLAPYRHTEHITLRQGEKFKKPPQPTYLHKSNGSQHHTSTHEVSLSIDPGTESDQDVQNLSQTEAPFNPKYTTTKMAATPHRREPQNKFKIDGEKESGEEIFDFKESINPHNLGVIRNLEEGGSVTTVKTVPFHTNHTPNRNSDLTKKPSLQKKPIPNATTYPYISKPSVNMQPPPPVQPVRKGEVMGLSPPPPPVSMSAPPLKPPVVAVASRPQYVSHPTQQSMPTVTGRVPPPPSSHKPHHKHKEQPVYAFEENLITTPSTPTKTPSDAPNTAQKATTSSNMVLMPEILIVPLEETHPSTPAGPTYVAGRETTLATATRQTPKPTHRPQKNSEIPPAAETERPNEMFHPAQRIPDEIMILGSELEEPNYMTTTSTLSNNHQQHPTLLSISTKTRLVSKIVLPTKYITNMKTLTVTTTKTTVVKSQGIPSTRTLIFTKTRTSTIVDTITQTATETATETQIHTLLQPTKVTISSPPEIRTTITTVYTLPEYQNYPVFSSQDKNLAPEKSDQGNDAVLLFVEDSEGSLDELIINYDDQNITTSTEGEPMSSSSSKSSNPPSRRPTPKNPERPYQLAPENESIFVVMTDKKNHPPGVMTINASNIETIDDPDYDLPRRDEDPEDNGPNHVLLGGILIATPPKGGDGELPSARDPSIECRPDCKAARNELCQRIEGNMKCVCRPGFARMFPDRPCKPTYTYSLAIPIYRFGKERLLFDAKLADHTSDEFLHWAGVTHDALDRMVMQSDFRDVYHGVHVTGFERHPTDNGVVGNFYLQLSDNSDDNRLVDVFKKYLRSNNYSIGGTDLHTVKSGVDELKARDFNECLDTKFHDCSENSQCFNLHGTYTCSCKNGYADLSENPVYPGRKCSADLIGCEKCNYHGTCYAPNGMEQPICECFHWYAGESCQVNLKILLIALIAIGASLLVLLFFCILVTCSKRRRSKSPQSIIAGINILPPKGGKSFSRNLKMEKRAMIKDSGSEISQTNTLPYVSKDTLKKHSTTSSPNPPLSSQSAAAAAAAEAERRCNLLDQNDRSLTVMIPRAKYHPVPPQSPVHVSLEGPLKVMGSGAGSEIISAAAESKILSYLDASGNNNMPSKRNLSASLKHHHSRGGCGGGALVSAGFEVSATVGQDKGKDEKSLLRKKYSSSGGNFIIDSMDNWLDTMQQNELTVSEARSYDETTIQPPTKSLRSMYEKQLSQMNNDEANTMAERDVGSTFLLPHTHLYKPDRGSDISGFDSF